MQIDKKRAYTVGFMALEVFAFLLPAFPPYFEHRIAMLMMYYIGHVSGLARGYKRIKNEIFCAV